MNDVVVSIYIDILYICTYIYKYNYVHSGYSFMFDEHSCTYIYMYKYIINLYI